MKKNSTELAFILDKSGSMHGLEKDTIGGFNSMLDKQKAAEGECRVTTVLFDSSCTVLHDRIDIAAVRPMTDEDYCAGGSTALLDAVGTTIDKIRNVQKNSAEEGRAEKVLFVIITDGMENASHRYTYDQIKKMISRQKERYGWEFLFIGANIDAAEVAGRVGIARERTANYRSDSMGTQVLYESLAAPMTAMRKGCAIDPNWAEEIENDLAKRSPKP